MMLNNKKAVSPLVATIILVLFSLILGTITMNLGKNYIEGISKINPEQPIAEDKNHRYIDGLLYQCFEIDPDSGECVRWELDK